MLIVFSGLPGTGKTTIASALARRINAVYLRIDSIEQAIRDAGALVQEVGTSGYRIANALALSNLGLGHRVIVDCVNPVFESRDDWSKVARHAGVPLVNIEVTCSDKAQHRRRVETRTGDIPGLVPPTWQSVMAHTYEPWADAPFSIDTAQVSPTEAVAMIAKAFLPDAPQSTLPNALNKAGSRP
ncbi:AAA family ATPase [Pseudomonas sp. CCM 7891]|uniref:AAA family ATPase n=1 Tax=Pseudomonas karstica TaxID=1055468 RepID=A0A7X2RXB9_9PSED|nr:AAA family ATPase [Pseudomonas karstica]MTD21745.1 AAA family ATPase [Pseudomonas karstica]